MKYLIAFFAVLMFAAPAYAQLETPSSAATPNAARTDRAETITEPWTFEENITVGDTEAPGLVGLYNADALPDAELGDGITHYNGDVYLRTTDSEGIVFLKKVTAPDEGFYLGSCLIADKTAVNLPPTYSCGDGKFYSEDTLYERITEAESYAQYIVNGADEVQGSYYGPHYFTGVDLPAMDYGKQYMYSNPAAGYTATSSYNYTNDGLPRFTIGTNDTGVLSLVLDDDTGIMANYTQTPLPTDLTKGRQEFFQATTGLTDADITALLIVDGYIQPCAAAEYRASSTTAPMAGIVLSGNELSGSTVVNSLWYGVVAEYNGDVEGAPLENLIVYSIGPDSLVERHVIDASPVAGQKYHVAMVFDGTTGVDVYLDGVLVADENDAQVPWNEEGESGLDDWPTKQHGYYFGTSTGGTGNRAGGYTNFRIDGVRMFHLEAE